MKILTCTPLTKSKSWTSPTKFHLCVPMKTQVLSSIAKIKTISLAAHLVSLCPSSLNSYESSIFNKFFLFLQKELVNKQTYFFENSHKIAEQP